MLCPPGKLWMAERGFLLVDRSMMSICHVFLRTWRNECSPVMKLSALLQIPPGLKQG